MFQDSLQKLCLSGSGKGRLTFLSGRYSFSYESLLESKIHNWTLALDVPMLGQELFKLSYQHADKGEIIASGNFYKRLQKDAAQEQKSNYQLELLDSYLGGYARFLKWYEAFFNDRASFFKSCTITDQNEISGQCSFWGEQLVWSIVDANLVLSFPLKNEDRFVFEAEKLNKNYFQQQKMSLKEKAKPNSGRTSLQIELYQSSCDRE